MPDHKITNLSVREDRPTAISSSALGANVDALGFNLAFIAMRNPKLAVELIRLYNRAHEINESDPNAPSEDLDLFREELGNLDRADA